MKRHLVDAGPLVAFLDKSEAAHPWVRKTFSRITSPLITCEAVLTEACFLVEHLPGGQAAILALITQGVIAPIEFRLAPELEAIRKLMAKYAGVPMTLADACLVRMTELHADSIVLTLDSDFHVYRRNGRQIVPIKSPLTDTED